MKPYKEFKSPSEIRRLFLQPVEGSTKVTVGDKHYFMVTIDRKFSEGEIKRRKKPSGVFSVNEKTCITCKQTKGVKNHFYTSTNSKDGYGGMCKECVKVQGKEYYEHKKEEKRKQKIEDGIYETFQDLKNEIEIDYHTWKGIVNELIVQNFFDEEEVNEDTFGKDDE